MRTVEARRGYYIVRHGSSVERAPFSCSMCTQVMMSHDDVVTHSKYGCCAWCTRMWVSGRHEAWIAGWRPDRRVVDETLQGLGIVKS